MARLVATWLALAALVLLARWVVRGELLPSLTNTPPPAPTKPDKVKGLCWITYRVPPLYDEMDCGNEDVAPVWPN